MTETELLAEVTALCDRLGLLWHHDPDSRLSKGSKGFPDLVICGEGGVVFRELKGENGETSADQDRWGWTFCGAEIAMGIQGLWGVWYPFSLHNGIIEATLSLLAQSST